MKNLKRIVICVVVFAMMLSTCVLADSPINTIIDSSDPDSDSFQNLISDNPNEVTISGNQVRDDGGGWLMDIINSIIGILSTGLLLPILSLFGIDHVSKIIFNHEPMVRLSFFTPNATGAAPSLMNAIAPVYVAFRYIAIICYVAIILYLAIRMLLSTVGKQKAMYKELMKHWFAGVIILLTFNWLMTYTIVLADTLTEILATSVGYDGSTGSNFMSDAIGSYKTIISTGIIAPIYVLCLIGMSVAVWWTYLKRVFTVGLLIMIFPLVTITYVFDKIGDRKSQILSAWIKEYMHNVFLQPIQALALVLICIGMQAASGFSGAFAPIIKLIMLFMLFPAEKLLKKIFDVNPSIGGKGFAGAGAGLVTGAMTAAKAIPVLKNNVRNFKESRNASDALKLAEMKHAKGELSPEKLAEARAKAKAAKGRTFEAATGLAGTAFGMGLTGNFGHALGIGAAFDKGTGWASDKLGNFDAKKTITDQYDGLKNGVNSNNLTEQQKKLLANRMGISSGQLDNMLKNPGGRNMINDFLDMEKNSALAKLKNGDDSAELIKAQYADKVKLGKDGKFYENGVEKGSLESVRVGKGGFMGMDGNGDYRKSLLGPDGKPYKNSKIPDGTEYDYKVDLSGPAGPVVLCKDQKDRAAETAKRETLSNAGLENASVAEQDAYLAGPDGKKRYTDNYAKARNEEIQLVENLREATGNQNLQVTNLTEVQVTQSTSQPLNLPGGAPYSAPPVDLSSLAGAMTQAMQQCLAAGGTTAFQGFPQEMQSALREMMQSIPAGGGQAGMEQAAMDFCQNMSEDTQRKMKDMLDKHERAQIYTQTLIPASSDSSNVGLSNSEKNNQMLAASREARKRAGLDASWG